MNCPQCGHGYSIVKDSRTTNNTKMRRRECCGCGHRFTCYEMSEKDYKKFMRLQKKSQEISQIMEAE